jgi:hypothetical protein
MSFGERQAEESHYLRDYLVCQQCQRGLPNLEGWILLYIVHIVPTHDWEACWSVRKKIRAEKNQNKLLARHIRTVFQHLIHKLLDYH